MNAKVLLVEDDKFLRNALRDGIKRAGFDVEIAADGQEGLDKMMANPPDLVLLDLIMPIKTGFEVLEDVQLHDDKLKTIPIIILSNLGQPQDVQRCKELGAVDYLIKSDMPMKKVVEKVKFYLAKTKT